MNRRFVGAGADPRPRLTTRPRIETAIEHPGVAQRLLALSLVLAKTPK